MEWLLGVGALLIGLGIWFIVGAKPEPEELRIFDESEDVLQNMEAWFE